MADNDDDAPDMASIMGFSSFGGEKKARKFDFMEMFEKTRKTAIERSHANIAAREELPSDPGGSFQKLNIKTSETSKNESIASNADKQEDDDDIIGPPLPPNMMTSEQDVAGSDDDEEEEEEEEEDETPLGRVPSSQEISLEHGDKMVSALCLDPSGARLVSGGADYDVKFWDFAGMDASLQSFRTIRPCECHTIRSVEYSSTGNAVLVVAGNSQAKIIDRDAFELFECTKGDQYLSDMGNTKGHTAMLNSGCWNPKVKDEFMTCSNDCSVRLWDVNQKGKKHKNLIRTKSAQGRKTIPTTCAYSRDGLYVTAACQDGSIQIWDHRKNFVNVSMMNRTAHTAGTDTSSLCFSYDGKTLASRGGDDTVKLWDIRQFKKPLAVAEDLANFFSMSDCFFSPDDKLLATGVSVTTEHDYGQLVFLDRFTLDRVSQLNVCKGQSVIRCLWHPKVNQMAVGCSNGLVKIYYDPAKSHRGVKLCVGKTRAKTKQVEMMVSRNVITPYALPMFRQNKATSTKKQEEKSRKDPVKSHRPDLPVSGPGAGGRLRAKGATLSQYVLQQLVVRNPDERDKDPRGAILRHAEDASENPYWVAPAYEKTQPKVVFQEETEEKDDEDNDDEPSWKKRKL